MASTTDRLGENWRRFGRVYASGIAFLLVGSGGIVSGLVLGSPVASGVGIVGMVVAAVLIAIAVRRMVLLRRARRPD